MSLNPTGKDDKKDEADIIVELNRDSSGRKVPLEGHKLPSQWNFLDLLSFSWMNR